MVHDKSPSVLLFNGKYPNSNLYFDFYFPKLDMYLEIAGRLDINDYVDRMIFKMKKFNAIVIKPRKHLTKFQRN